MSPRFGVPTVTSTPGSDPYRKETPMTTSSMTRGPATRRSAQFVGWGLLVGGAFFFTGGSMHPKEDPPGVSLKEHLRVMYEDPVWYPSHTVLLIGMMLIAASLVVLARGRSLASVPRV